MRTQVMAVKGYEGTRSIVDAANLSLDTFLPEVRCDTRS